MHDIQFTAVACRLAVAMHHARIEVWPDREYRPWEDLSARERAELVEHAGDVLEAVRPLPKANVVSLADRALALAVEPLRRMR